MLISEYEWQVVLLSLRVASIAVACSLPFGIFIAWLLVRCQFRGKALLNAIVHLSLVLPPVVVGYLLLLLFGRKGYLGRWLLEWFDFSFMFNWMGAALAAAVVAFPLMVRSIRLALESIDIRLEQAAKTLGAGSWRIFFTITLPLSFSGILSGIILAFARSLGEFGATITFVSNIPGQTNILPIAIYSLIQIPGSENATIRLCIFSILLSMISLLVSEWLIRRNQQRLEK